MIAYIFVHNFIYYWLNIPTMGLLNIYFYFYCREYSFQITYSKTNMITENYITHSTFYVGEDNNSKEF